MQLRISFTDGSQVTQNTGPAVNDGMWHHLATVWDATARTYSLYVDYTYEGQIDVSGDSRSWNVTSTAPDVEMSVGAFNWAGFNGNYLSGDLDEVRLSDQVLLPAEFLQAPIPEPSTLLALLLGAALLAPPDTSPGETP